MKQCTADQSQFFDAINNLVALLGHCLFNTPGTPTPFMLFYWENSQIPLSW